MSELIKKIKSWYSGLKTQKPLYDKGGIKPSKDWKIILSITSIVLLVLASFSLYFYFEIENGTFFNVDGDNTSNDVKINNSLLKKIVDDIHQREISIQDIRNKRISIPNP